MKYTIKILILILAAILLIGCTQQTTTNNQPAPQESAKQTTITIQNFAFNPSTLTVISGTTVAWINEDSASHTIKSDIFTSDTLKKGDSFEFKFENKGTYEYTCRIHPSMKGKIIVN